MYMKRACPRAKFLACMIAWDDSSFPEDARNVPCGVVTRRRAGAEAVERFLRRHWLNQQEKARIKIIRTKKDVEQKTR